MLYLGLPHRETQRLCCPADQRQTTPRDGRCIAALHVELLRGSWGVVAGVEDVSVGGVTGAMGDETSGVAGIRGAGDL